jgi:hypothetical protein
VKKITMSEEMKDKVEIMKSLTNDDYELVSSNRTGDELIFKVNFDYMGLNFKAVNISGVEGISFVDTKKKDIALEYKAVKNNNDLYDLFSVKTSTLNKLGL